MDDFLRPARRAQCGILRLLPGVSRRPGRFRCGRLHLPLNGPGAPSAFGLETKIFSVFNQALSVPIGREIFINFSSIGLPGHNSYCGRRPAPSPGPRASPDRQCPAGPYPESTWPVSPIWKWSACLIGFSLQAYLRGHAVKALRAFFRTRQGHIGNRPGDPAVAVLKGMDRHKPEVRKACRQHRIDRRKDNLRKFCG